MTANTGVNGKTTSFMVMENTLTRMGHTEGNTWLIQSMVLEFLNGQMVKSTKDSGKKVNKKAKVDLPILWVKASVAHGKMEIWSSGTTKAILLLK